jgi:hypothetical protein
MHSFKDYTNQSLKDRPVEEFSGQTIKGSCFYQEVPYGGSLPTKGVDIFPDGMTGATFVRCNMDNVYVPPGNFVIAGDGVPSSTRKIMTDDEGFDCLAKDNASVLEPDKENRLGTQ